MCCQCTCVPKFDASVGVELWVSVNLLYSDAHSAGARVAAEIGAEIPSGDQTHLEESCLVLGILGANISRHEQHHAG